MCYHVIGFPSPGPPDRLGETARPASLPAACLHGAGIWGLGAGVWGPGSPPWPRAWGRGAPGTAAPLPAATRRCGGEEAVEARNPQRRLVLIECFITWKRWAYININRIVGVILFSAIYLSCRPVCFKIFLCSKTYICLGSFHWSVHDNYSCSLTKLGICFKL